MTDKADHPAPTSRMDADLRRRSPLQAALTMLCGAGSLVDLPGEGRILERIVFWYQTPALARECANVQVWARG